MGVTEAKKTSIMMRALKNPKGKNKHLYSLISFLFVVIFTVLIYLVPDFYFLEKITHDTVFGILTVYQYDIVNGSPWNEIETGTVLLTIANFLSGIFDGHGGWTPVIESITAERRFAIVRACTGMQAGALLMSLIMVTPADFWNKVKATFFTLIALIIGNFFRIALVIGMTVTFEVALGASGTAAWMWAHDVLGKPIGFFGTIFFALIIEKQGVPILNTVSLWIDSVIDIIPCNKKKTKTTSPKK